MRLVASLALVALAACSSVSDRAGCSDTSPCPSGQYCAHTADGNVCWADAVAPTVGGVTVTCDATPCLRNGVLTVSATVTDDHGLGPVTASLDLDGNGRKVTMSRTSGDAFQAQLDLGQWAFPALQKPVVATVTATDGAGLSTSTAAAALAVTRVVGEVPLDTSTGVSPTAPAALPGGTLAIGESNGKLFLVPPGGPAQLVQTFSSPVSQPPSVGSSALWVAAGNTVYALSLDGGSVLNGAGYDTGGTIVGPAAVSAGLSPELAFVASAGASSQNRVTVTKPDPANNGFVAASVRHDAPFCTGPVLAHDRSTYAVTGQTGVANAILRQFTYDVALAENAASREVGQSLSAPLAVGSDGSIWTGAADLAQTSVRQTTSSFAPGVDIALGASVGGGIVLLASGDLAVSAGPALRRFTSAGLSAWTTPPTLDGIGLTPILLTGDATFLVPTRNGTVHAISGAGVELWRATLSARPLSEGNIHTAPGKTISTAYFTSADGVLHALLVDGALDTSAPWPKAWHDPRNTSNLTTPF